MKKTIKIIILLMIMLMGSITVSHASTRDDYPCKGNTYYHFNEKPNTDHGEYTQYYYYLENFTENKTVPLKDWTEKDEWNGNNCVLYYENVFCVEGHNYWQIDSNGTDTYEIMSNENGTAFCLSVAKNSSYVDKGFAYILSKLCYGHTGNYGYNKVQLALWKWLSEYKDSVIKDSFFYNYIYQKNPQGYYLDITGTGHQDVYDSNAEAQELFNEAKIFANDSTFEGTYYVYFVMLKSTFANGDPTQRLMIVTGISKPDKTYDPDDPDNPGNPGDPGKPEEPEKPKYVDVSLQKYITQVNGTDVSSSRFSFGASGKVNYVEAISNFNNGHDKTKSGKADYKNSHPVEIEAGDSVTYIIWVYNNSDTDASNITVTDTLPKNIDTTNVQVKKEGGSYTKHNCSNGRIILQTGLNAHTCTYYYVKVYFNSYSTDKIWNVANITSTSPQNKSTYRQEDGDSIKMKEYKVSLEKYVSAVNGKSVDDQRSINPLGERSGKAEYLTLEDKVKYLDYTENDKKWTQHNEAKYHSPVTVGKGDKVTYTIKVRNDGETQVKITEITDTLPKNGIKKPNNAKNDGTLTLTGTSNVLLESKKTASVILTLEVTEPNISLDVLKNTAEITQLKNKNGIVVNDKTPYNNKDSDYIQMKDITIAGNVWNDLRDDTKAQKYDGKFSGRDENLKEIKVYLYRDDFYRNNVLKPIAEKTTDQYGYYSFSKADIINDVPDYKKYIKGPKNIKGNNRWSGDYYSYWVVFEYDGVKYTTTPDGKTYTPINAANTSTTNYIKDNNAREKLNIPQQSDESKIDGLQAREAFNYKFSKINGNGAYDPDNKQTTDITYTTKNENGYVPQSNYEPNDAMKAKLALTNKITLSKNENLEKQLQHVDMGLRGRDAFDLHLTNYASSVQVNVNGKSNTYQFSDIEAKKAIIRKTDIVQGTTNIGKEDTVNVAKEKIDKYILKDEQKQKIRETDIKNDAWTEEGTGLEVFVTYKITVTNASITPGTATKITDYYDSKVYESPRCYYIKENKITDLKIVDTKKGYNWTSITIPTQATMLKPDDSMDIYVVFKLNDASKTLEKLLSNQSLPTFNMAEITEYKTQCGENQTEYTRGLIDINSAPESVNEETVRTEHTIAGRPSTVDAFFAEANKLRDGRDNYLEKIKYEDDTYTAPMLYFVADENVRTITGTIFEDNTSVNEERVRSGNGKIDEGEKKVRMVQVELIELIDGDEKEEKVRYTTTSSEDGSYTFSGFLPGDYIIRYTYGNDLKNVIVEGNNEKSYNGEDFESTNNIGSNGVCELNKTKNFWYLYNENNEKGGISTGTDDVGKRNTVSQAVTNFSDKQMTVLNNMRDGKKAEESKVTYKDESGNDVIITVDNIKDATQMNANTQKMLMTVEKSKLDDNDKIVQPSKFEKEYDVTNMNFGIAQVPVTTIDLQKHVKAITIKDSAGVNTIAKLEANDEGEWTIEGDIIGPDKEDKTINFADISIEEEKMQGAKLEVTYEISSKLNVEKNFDNTEGTVATITGLVDFVNNKLSYNEELSYNGVKNGKNWEVTTFDKVKNTFIHNYNDSALNPDNEKQLKDKAIGTVDPEGTKYTTIVKAKAENPILTNNIRTGKATITLEQVLSSSNATIGQIITSTVGTEEYGNIVEIASIDYANSKASGTIQRDRVIRFIPLEGTPTRFIPLAGIQHDSAQAELITIHEPTGVGNSINTTYYVLAVISLVVLAGGVFGIKKFVLKN